MNLPQRLLSLYRVPGLRLFAHHAMSLLGVQIPVTCRLDSGIELPHGATGLVLHETTVVGSGTKLYQGVTVGRSDTWKAPSDTAAGGSVIIGSDVTIGAGAAVLFQSGQTLEIGDGAVVGANSVVTRNVPAAEIWAGSPARFIRRR